MNNLTRLAVYCGSASGSKPVFADATRATARAMVENGVDLVYGGGRLGCMGIIADSVATFFANERNRSVVEKLRTAGVNFEGPPRAAPSAAGASLAGTTFVITGTLDGFTRDEATAEIVARALGSD